jgi:hypothetical protein
MEEYIKKDLETSAQFTGFFDRHNCLSKNKSYKFFQKAPYNCNTDEIVEGDNLFMVKKEKVG